MPQNFLSCDRDQPMLLPPDLRDWLSDDHLACSEWRLIAATHNLLKLHRHSWAAATA